MTQSSIFHSPFIIDGLTMDSTPAALLGEESVQNACEPVVDESLDPSPGGYPFDERKINDYLKLVRGRDFPLELPYAQPWARCQLARNLIDTLWRKGKFVLSDIRLGARVSWRAEKIGEGAALYAACEGVSELAGDLDLPIVERDFSEGEPSLCFAPIGLQKGRMVGETLKADPDSWIIYMPFDTDDFHLGGSALASALGIQGGVAPKMDDPDYFIDCFEVIREMAEDSVLLSGCTVGRGGLMAALDSMTSRGIGAAVDLSDLRRAYGSSDPVRILFSEVPGALIQISDADFDYVDAELLLQDVMYFPLGHPVPGRKEVKVSWSDKPALGAILDSLVR